MKNRKKTKKTKTYFVSRGGIRLSQDKSPVMGTIKKLKNKKNAKHFQHSPNDQTWSKHI